MLVANGFHEGIISERGQFTVKGNCELRLADYGAATATTTAYTRILDSATGKSTLTVNMYRSDLTDLAQAFDIGWWHAPKGTDPASYVLRHEFGHILDNATGAAAREIKAVEAIFREHVPGSSDLNTYDLVVGAHRGGLVSEYTFSKYKEDYRGVYWSDAFSEAIAEAFATVASSPGYASGLEKALYDRLMTLYWGGV